MRGRKPLPRAMPDATPANALPRCPPHLSDTARREWRRLAGPLHKIGLLTLADRAVLAVYCQAYLVAIIDWHTRKVLAWRKSNTLEADFCFEALNEAIARIGPPEIMNTDQGSQFTSFAWTNRLRRTGVRISRDGKGRFLDNIFVERL